MSKIKDLKNTTVVLYVKIRIEDEAFLDLLTEEEYEEDLEFKQKYPCYYEKFEFTLKELLDK